LGRSNRSSQSWPSAPAPAALPRRRPKLVAAREGGARTKARAAEPARILVVEDDFLVAMQLEIALAEAGYAIAGIAATAEEAVALARTAHPVLAVMDIRLAGERDGIDAALDLFRELGLRSIFATAHVDQDVRKRAKPAAPLGWLQKPYTMTSLVQIVRQALAELGGGKKN